ncbi:DNA polymerase I [uncultured Albimonas sp.]|uniref:DNA polymerase I n=1 Tax=uncultured Albimonas sp. TaxID=1331701 RepID=UPI0030EE4AC0|tara:strand:+ start:442 stop:3309 length:2868 start_codon:yes stop_codon:yes gene_type:complete
MGPGDRLELIDGSGFIFRAYHALPALTRKSDGLPVGAVAGFCNMLQKILEARAANDAEAPTHAAVIFDYSAKTFRNDIYPEYKAHRPEPPEDLRPQFALIRDATRAFNMPCIEMEGYEADDLIATYARQAEAAGARVSIVSSDKDLMQLVTDAISIVKPGLKGAADEIIGADGVREKFGVGPERVIDVQALAGDSVDNVPGAPGIGLKTAALLINEYGDLDTLLTRAEEIKQPKRRQTLIDNADQVRTSRELVTLCAEVPVEDPLDSFALRDPEPETLLGFLRLMEFRTLTARVAERLGVTDLPSAAAPEGASPEARGETGGKSASASADWQDPALTAPIDPASYEIVRDADALRAWIAKIEDRGEVAIDTETTSLDEMVADLVGVSLSVTPGEACYVPFGHMIGDGDLLGAAEKAPGQMDREEALEILRPMLVDPAILKIGQNLKYDLKVLARHGVPVAPIDDTMLISYALDAGLHGHGMDTLSDAHLDHRPIPIKELIGTGKSAITFDRVEVDKAAPYAAEDADVTLRLHRILKPRLAREGLASVYEVMERPLIPVLAEMEMAGIKVDRQHLSRMSGRFAQRMAGLEAEIHQLAGDTFNVGSPKQLGEILFEKMQLPGGKKGKNGAWGTGADILETLAAEQGSELAARVLDWRQVSKLKSTYTDALQEHINPETGRVHTSFSLAATSTGRLASTDPNLQNIPVRTEMGREIRAAFVAEPGNVIVSLDYSQIELRILAHIAGIEALKQAFRDGQDIHAMTASEVFGVPMEEMTPEIRRQAKAINFGVIYGISAFGLSNNLRIPREAARTFIDAYFEKFPGIKAYMDATVAGAKETGYVSTLFGRRIHTPEIGAKGPRAGFAQRAAINAPIQGTAADIIRRAMIRVPEAMAKAKLSGRMLLQVHDELLFEVPKTEAEDTIAAIRRTMEGAALPAVDLSTPLVVDAGQGASWAEAH